MSEVKVNKISPRTNCGTVTVGDSGDSVTVTAGVPVTVNGDLKSNALKAVDGGSIISQCGTSITLGASGDTINLASGASQTGFGRTGTVDWQTGSIKTGNFTATSGEGYFVNTTSGAVTATLPASPSAGDIVGFNDYARTFATNNLTIGRNSSNIQGSASDATSSTNGQSLMFVYVDATKGWIPTEDQTTTMYGAQYISATGGNTISTCGDFKTHIFTGPGTFCVSQIAGCSANNEVDYVVVAGGGGGAGASPGSGGRGGAGAGGFRISNSLSLPAPLTSPLANTCGVTVTAQSYPITVGGGGGGGPAACAPTGDGTKGSNSIFSTVTSTAGGRGNAYPHTCSPGGCAQQNGGSGGGGYGVPCQTQGAGNTPPTTPPQGNPALNAGSGGGSGGGGAGASPPATVPNPDSGSAGGAGSYIDANFIGPTAPSYGETGPVGSTRYFAGGGAGGSYQPGGTQLSGGVGGGGDGGNGNAPFPSTAGTTNTGGGGGGGGGGAAGSAGGSGIIMIRYKYQ